MIWKKLSEIWRSFKRKIGSPVKNFLYKPYRICVIRKVRKRIPGLEQRLQDKEVIRVVFFVMNIAMWKCDRLFKMMLEDGHFSPWIVLSPRIQTTVTEKQQEMLKMQRFFRGRGYPLIDIYDCVKDEGYDVENRIKPDIVFYPQPYDVIIAETYRYYHFPQALFCYVPYDFKTTAYWWGYDNILQNIAWKLFYPTDFHRKDAERLSWVKGKNVVVTGYPVADEFLDSKRKIEIPWKNRDSRLKRLVWAPHYTIVSHSVLNFSTFMSFHEFMFDVAQKYKDRLQIAFKPHPHLRSALYNYPEWGKERTDKYYLRWADLPNGILADGDYIDLFLTSDAMIHDCGSFSVEYHYTCKPVMFLAKPDHLRYESEFGKLTFDMHYKGCTCEDIIGFIENVILKGDDPMRPLREDFFRSYLLPPGNKTATENIFEVISIL